VRRRDDVRPRRPAGRGLRPAGAVSLARALSKFGVTSRREAERWIADGRVRLNGALERSPSRWIDPAHDHVVVDGRPVGDETPRVVLAFHKPAGFVTTRADPGGRPTVYDALGDVGRWVFPVGRLDRDTSGLLILTNDHRLGERLTSPDYHVPKTYHARVLGVPDGESLRALRESLTLDDGTVTRPARVRALGTAGGASAGLAGSKGRGSSWLEIVLTEGKNRQVRRMGAAVGHEVVELVRVRIGRLDLGALAPGEWRELGPEEVENLASTARPPRQ
jgi:23S rRNA pseudouridine2605 synthase